MTDNQEFYIGYLPKMGSRTTRIVTGAVVVFIMTAAIVLGAVISGQNRFAAARFDFGNVQSFEGTIETGAVTFLAVDAPARPDGLPAVQKLPLVGEGKHGVELSAFDHDRVSLRGTLIERDGLRMIELEPESVRSLGPGRPPELTESLGEFTLRGEIVDSKCYLGVMNPGQWKPHRDCAVACIRGGIPPLFIVRDMAGNVSELWIVGRNGEPIGKSLLDFVAEPIELSGKVERRGDQLFFKIKPVGT